MPRDITIPIVDYPDRTPGRAYRLRVCALNRPRKQSHLLALFEDLEPEQEGRQLEAQLPIPCRPTGLTAEFIAACGHPVQPGTAVRVKDCIDKVVIARFRRSESGDSELASFEPVIPETLYAPAPESAEPDSRSTPTAQADANGDRRR